MLLRIHIIKSMRGAPERNRWCVCSALGILLVMTRAAGVLGSALPLVDEDFRPIYAVDLLEPQAVTVPGKAVIDYKVRSIGAASAMDVDPRAVVGISVDGRILAYQSLAQCLGIPCWLPLARYPLATFSGDHALEVQVVLKWGASHTTFSQAFHAYTVRRVDLSQNISDGHDMVALGGQGLGISFVAGCRVSETSIRHGRIKKSSRACNQLWSLKQELA